MRVSVIVPTRNRASSLARLIAALRDQDWPAESLELVVAMDRCTDATASMRSQPQYSDVNFVESSGVGAGAARNCGVAASTGEVMIFLDDDMEPSPGLVRAHAEAHCADESGKLVVVGDAPVAVDDSSTTVARSLARVYDRYFERLRSGDEVLLSEGLLGGNFSVRRQFFDEVGGFDDKLPLREDFDFGLRLRTSGGIFRHVPAALAIQHVTIDADDIVARAPVRAQADLALASRYPQAVRSLELHRMLATPRGLARTRVFWILNAMGAAPVVKFVRGIFPGSERLVSWHYMLEYWRAVRSEVADFRTVLEMTRTSARHG